MLTRDLFAIANLLATYINGDFRHGYTTENTKNDVQLCQVAKSD